MRWRAGGHRSSGTPGRPERPSPRCDCKSPRQAGSSSGESVRETLKAALEGRRRVEAAAAVGGIDSFEISNIIKFPVERLSAFSIRCAFSQLTGSEFQNHRALLGCSGVKKRPRPQNAIPTDPTKPFKLSQRLIKQN